MFKKKSHSTFVVGIRRLDVVDEDRGKHCTWAPLLVTEGPTEPPSLTAILQPTVQFFKAHAPGGEGTCPCSISVVIGGRSTALEHWPILAVVVADIPAMALLMCLCGHTAFNACYRCFMPGVHINHAVRCAAA